MEGVRRCWHGPALGAEGGARSRSSSCLCEIHRVRDKPGRLVRASGKSWGLLWPHLSWSLAPVSGTHDLLNLSFPRCTQELLKPHIPQKFGAPSKRNHRLLKRTSLLLRDRASTAPGTAGGTVRYSWAQGARRAFKSQIPNQCNSAVSACVPRSLTQIETVSAPEQSVTGTLSHWDSSYLGKTHSSADFLVFCP